MAGEPRDWSEYSAAEMLAAAGRAMARPLRELAPQLFGLINDELRLPAFVGSHSQRERAGQSRPAPAVRSAPISTVTLCYGLPEDPLSPYIEVLTDFTPEHKNTAALRFELGKAAGRARAGPDEHVRPGAPGHRPPRGPLERGRVEIVVAGSPARPRRRATGISAACRSLTRTCW